MTRDQDEARTAGPEDEFAGSSPTDEQTRRSLVWQLALPVPIVLVVFLAVGFLAGLALRETHPKAAGRLAP